MTPEHGTNRYWLAVGSRENWLTAFEYGNTWGLKNSQQGLWNQLSEDDTILFYVTSDVRGIVGYGLARGRFKQDKPLWPLELLEGRVIWPFRVEFEVEACLPPNQWRLAKVKTGLSRVTLRTGFQELAAELGQKLVGEVNESTGGKVNLAKLIATVSGKTLAISKEAAPLSNHDEAKAKLVEIGKLQRFLAETEYRLDGERIDVVWRRVERSVPTYVFEINVGGDVYHAIAKLKHAFDLWNSHIFLVANPQEKPKVEQLLSGTFHEIREELRFITLGEVQELYERKRGYKDLELRMGIL